MLAVGIASATTSSCCCLYILAWPFCAATSAAISNKLMYSFVCIYAISRCMFQTSFFSLLTREGFKAQDSYIGRYSTAGGTPNLSIISIRKLAPKFNIKAHNIFILINSKASITTLCLEETRYFTFYLHGKHC